MWMCGTMALLVFLIAFSALFPTTWGAAISHDNLSIIGGTEISIEYAPYMVALFYERAFICGGSIIHEKFILTAAHCVPPFRVPEALEVLIGSDRLNDGGVFVAVEKILAHERYDNMSRYDDIALLKLSQEVNYCFWSIHQLPAIIQLPADSRHILEGTMVNVTGWGVVIGDSGGPLTYNGVQIGIVSYGLECGRNPGVYTRVASYLDWIQDNIRDNN